MSARSSFAWRKAVSVAVVVLVAGSVAAAAVTSTGFHTRHVSLNDGGIWTAQANSNDPNNPGSFVGRANVQAEVIDAAVTALPRPQLLQNGPHVIFHDAATGSVTSVNTVLGQSGSALVVPPLTAPTGTLAAGTAVTQDNQGTPMVDLNDAGEVGLGADAVGIIDQSTGKVYVLPADGLPSGSVDAQKPVATEPRGSRLVVGLDGVTHVVTPAGAVDDFGANGRRLRHGSIGVDLTRVTTPGSPFTLTTVGSKVVVLDGNGGLYVEGHSGSVGSVSGASSTILQEPGAARPGVLVEAGSDLVRVDLSSGAVTVLSKDGAGAPTAPVYVPERGCAYAAWASRAAIPADASTTGSPAKPATAVAVCDNGRTYAGAGEENPVWRVNHGSALLNDELTGKNLYFDGVTPIAIDDWSQAQRPSKGEQSSVSSGTTLKETTTPQTPSTADHPPKANDDTLATRPGVPLIAHVLANDTDVDGDVLAVTSLSSLPVGGARVSIVDGGNDVQVTPAPDSMAPVTFDYMIDDGRGQSSSARVSVAIHPLSQNTAPTIPANEPAVTVAAGAHITVDLLRDVTDPDGDPLTLAVAKLPAGAGSVEFTPAGLAVVSPSTAGTVPLTFTVTDGHGGSSSGVQNFTVRDAGTAITPETHDDHLQVAVGSVGTVDVLANDVDGSGKTLSVTTHDSPAGLTITELTNTGGVFGVTATSVGTTFVHYTATDGTSQATSTLRVDAVEADPDQRVTAVRDDATLRTASPTVIPVLANDIDQAGNVLVIDGLSDVPPGLAVSQVNHEALSVTLTAPLQSAETFHYTASDGIASDVGTVVVRPAPGGVDQPPVTAPTVVTVRAGNAIPIDVLAHDFDPEGEALTLGSAAPLPSGQGTLFTEAGQLRYVAPETALGSVTGTYLVKDSAGNVSTGTVIIHVLAANATNNAPTPPDVTARVYTGRNVTVVLPLLGIDPDGDITTLVDVAPPTLGSAVLGTVDSPLGLDRFTFSAGDTGGTQLLSYQVRDSGGLLATGAIRIGIVAPPAQNSPPVALPDTVSLAPGALRRVAVLANDSDPDGDPLKLDADALTQPSGGKVAIDGSVIEVTAPAGAVDGPLSFAYGIDDGRGGTATSTVTETVTTHPPPVPPVAIDDLAAPQKAGSIVKLNVLANDTISNGTPAQAIVSAPGTPGVTVLPGGLVQFTMPTHPLSFAYTVTDAAGQTAQAVVTAPLALGLPPVASPDSATTTSGKPVTLDVTANDHDPQGLPLSVTKIQNTAGGRAVIAGSKVTFTPGDGFTGLGGFSYVLGNGQLTSVGTATVTVTGGADHPPVVQALNVNVTAGASTSVNLAAAASDPDAGDKLSFTNLTGTTKALSASLRSAQLTIAATGGSTAGTVLLRYTVSDGHPKGTVPGTVLVTVTPSAKAAAQGKPKPQALADLASTLQGKPVTIPVLANDVDPFGKGLHLVSVAGGGPAGSPAVTGSTVTFSPAAGYHGVVTLSYVAADASGDPARQATGTVTVTVIGRPDAPGNPSGTPSSHQVSLTWAVPSANGGTISGYTVSWNGGGPKACPLNTCVITGLKNGTDYTFTVTATDQAGDSPASAPSVAVHVDQVPTVPQAPTGTSGDQKISVTWPVPTGDGSAISSYDVVISPGGTKMTVSTNAATFTGLTNGTAYTFKVDATNKAGTSDFSADSAGVTPAGLPVAPGAPKASTTPDAQTAVATWSAPSSNGSPITSYTLQVYENGALRSTIVEKDTSNRTDTVSATNGDSYYFKVSATNAVGSSAYSAASNTVKATGHPAQVGKVTATGGHDSAVPLTWAAPSDNGSAITKYIATDSPGSDTQTFTTAGGTFTGLTNGKNYTFTVSACNANGCGTSSAASNQVMPYTTPDAPTASGSHSGDVINWSWTAPNDGGQPITHYLYSVDGGDFTATGPNGNGYSQNFACGTSHSLVVKAESAAGDSPRSNTDSETTADCPSPTLAISKGANPNGGSSANPCNSDHCAWVNIDGANFKPGSGYTLSCHSDIPAPAEDFKSYQVTADGSGNITVRNTGCYYGYPGGHVYVHSSNGVQSNTITW